MIGLTAPLAMPPRLQRWRTMLAVLVGCLLLLHTIPGCDGPVPMESAVAVSSTASLTIAPDMTASAPMGESPACCDGAVSAACCAAAIRQSSDMSAAAPMLAAAEAGALHTGPRYDSGAGCRAPAARSVEGLLALHCVWRT